MDGKKNGSDGSTRVSCFQMPLHYPRYSEEDYERMSEVVVDNLLAEYGLPTNGDLACKRNFAIGAFIWPKPTQ